MVYDLLFFFIVIIIVLNLIFGVIIDTFADLRSEKQKKEEILKTTCFICGECLGAPVGAPSLPAAGEQSERRCVRGSGGQCAVWYGAVQGGTWGAGV